METKDFWDNNGKEWVRILNEQRIASRPVTNAAILSEIESLKPISLLDMGCGEGWLSRALPKNIKYYGVDGSRSLIQSAQAQNKTQFFAVASYEDIILKKWIFEGKTDLLVFNFSLLDQKIESLLVNSGEFLTPHGHMLVQTVHPFFAVKEYTDTWNEDDFLSVSQEIEGTMPWYQRTLSSWVDVFATSGLVVKKITEPLFEGKPASLIFTLKKA